MKELSELSQGFCYPQTFVGRVLFPENKKIGPRVYKSMLRDLPPADLVHQRENYKLDVYMAKSLDESWWQSPELQRLVIETRKSYRTYGDDIPLLDVYDPKSAIFLVRSEMRLPSTDGINRFQHDWFSLRFVPAFGSPTSNEDLDFLVCQERGSPQQPILDAMRDRLDSLSGLSDSQALDVIAAQSRLCKIPPFQILSDYENIENGNIQVSSVVGKNFNIGLAFALMSKQFEVENSRRGTPIEIFTCQMHQEVSNSILTATGKDGGKMRLPFTQAWEALCLGDPGEVFIDRKNPSVYAYQYPGYFLNLDSLAESLTNLVETGILSKGVLENYILKPRSGSLEQVLDHPRITDFRKLGKMLTYSSKKIPGTNLSSTQLKDFLDQGVQDGPILRIMNRAEWNRGVDSMLLHSA